MPKQQSHQNSDTPWKKILRIYFLQAIQFYFPDLAKLIDWRKRPQFLDKELEQIAPKADQGNRYVDKLVRVWNSTAPVNGCSFTWKSKPVKNLAFLSEF
jgi:hypothetical protein